MGNNVKGQNNDANNDFRSCECCREVVFNCRGNNPYR